MSRFAPMRLSAGAVVVRRTPDGFTFLMLRAYRHWDFPKGIVEDGESAIEAARREIAEETTITDIEFEWGEEYLDTGPYSRDKIARYHLCVTRQVEVTLPVSEELGRPEHNEYRWVTLEQARQLAAPRVRVVIEWAASRLNIDE